MENLQMLEQKTSLSHDFEGLGSQEVQKLAMSLTQHVGVD